MKDRILFLIFVCTVAFFYIKATSDQNGDVNDNRSSQVAINNLADSGDVNDNRSSQVAINNLADSGGIIRYCYVGGWWKDDQKTMMENGFLSWKATGVVFMEDNNNCDTSLHLDRNMLEAGKATLFPGYIIINPDQFTPVVAVHEIGHNLGLDHDEYGLMKPVLELGEYIPPSEENINEVKRIWGTDK